jgi:hypothetical protein
MTEQVEQSWVFGSISFLDIIITDSSKYEIPPPVLPKAHCSKKIIMKFVSSLLVALFLLESVVSESDLYLVVRTVFNGQSLSATQVQSVTSVMNTEKPNLDSEIAQVSYMYKSSMISSTSTTSNNWNLRGRELQSCNYCPGFPTGFYCWVNGVRRPACRREMTVHETLDEAKLSEMSEDDRQRHLQAGSMCADAKADVVSVIKAKIAAGVVTAPYSSFSFECLYSVE